MARLRDDDGQIMGALALMAVAFVAGGMLLFQVGRATVLQTEAQTAADAAALAGGVELRRQIFVSDNPYTAFIDHLLVCTAAERYAARNDADLTSCRVQALDVVVSVRTRDRLGPQAQDADAENGRGEASARARVDPGIWAGGPGGFPVGGGGLPSGPLQLAPGAPEDPEDRLIAIAREADRIDRLNLPYLWGGGHQSSPAPPNGPFDCSGAVSRVLQAAGYAIPTSVSGGFMSAGNPGRSPSGRGVTIYAYSGHVFMVIGGRGWGTGDPVTGGAGWLPYNTPYHGLFVARHLPDLEGLDVDLGQVLGGGGGGIGGGGGLGLTTVRLVPLDDVP